eukprot:14902645-Ditylum_brightwellii.AAC.1
MKTVHSDGSKTFASVGSDILEENDPCFNLDNWAQTINICTDEVCNDDRGYCTARQGFVCAYKVPFKEQFEAASSSALHLAMI